MATCFSILARKNHGQRSLMGYSPLGCRARHNSATERTQGSKGFSQFSHSIMSGSVTPWTAAHQASLSNTNSWRLLKLMCIESVMPSNHLILSHPLLLLPSIFPSIRVFSSETVLHIMWPKDWSFSFSVSPPNEYYRLIFFRIDWLDLLAVQGTLKSILQHHNSQPSLWSNSHICTQL